MKVAAFKKQFAQTHGSVVGIAQKSVFNHNTGFAACLEDFNEMLLLIKNKVKKIVIVEHNRSIDPDYVIEVTQDDDGISSLTIN